MKIIKKVIVILIIMISILTVKAFGATGKINVSATRLRKEKNTTSEILTKIYEDEEVEILEDLGEWVKVKYKKQTGYIKKEFVTIKEENKEVNKKEEETTKKENISNYENTNQEPQNTNETVTIQKCSLKILPNFMSKQIQQFEKDTKLTIITTMNEWVRVTDGTVIGWVLKTKLNIKVSDKVNSLDLENITTNTSTENNQTNNTVSDNKNANSVNQNQISNSTNKNNTTNNKNNTTNNKNNTTNNTISNKLENTTTNSKVENSSSITSVSKKGKVNVETANVRKEPSTSAKRVDFLDEGDIVTISEETDKWYKVKHKDIEGYVSKDLITIINEKETISSRSLTEERRDEKIESETSENQAEKNQESEEIVEVVNKTSGNEVVEYAKKFLGYSYVSGGKKPETGFDCSGFTYYIYKNFGYKLSTVSYAQTSVGTEITRENLKPGDLILFYNEAKTKIGHTGIYIGNGEFIHAANPERGVVCDNLNTLSYYNERFVTARRIVE